MLQRRNIIWRKWQDPLAPLIDGKPAKTYEPEEDEESPDLHKSNQSFDKEPPPYKVPKSKQGFAGPAILGPMGIIPLHESNIPSFLFNFWQGDTDFDITRKVAKMIAAVPGVETLDILTRYRFRLGIGRAFKEDQVKRVIEEVLNPPQPQLPPPKSESPHTHIKKMLSKKFSHWAIFVMPEGKIEVAGGASEDEVREKGKAFEQQAQQTILSWEKE